ncbi:MAG: hypothetical protein E6J74_28750 [Deltaproteobacteria bacterium]|jgi:hypothetical protein|nr:MAG: hypothetical protein E6J74_28750 [Deltaproteobacteria bacterium]
MKYFDYESVAREAKISPAKLRHLLNLLREEFPNDPLMYELHVLRACMAVRDGHISINDVLKRNANNHL